MLNSSILQQLMVQTSELTTMRVRKVDEWEDSPIRGERNS